MKTDTNDSKIKRTLSLYTKLLRGECIQTDVEAKRHGVTARSIQRDMKDIQAFLTDATEREPLPIPQEVRYNHAKKGYELVDVRLTALTDGEILAICKILLDSRAFTKKEMKHMLDKLITGCVIPTKQEQIRALIKNEVFHYVQPRHKRDVIDVMWHIGEAIRSQHYISIQYLRLKDKSIVTRKIKPAAIMFSEYYFYVAAFIEDPELAEYVHDLHLSPTIYRMDRIKTVHVLDETFRTPYANRFQEGEFRKRIQFMYSGKLETVRFVYTGLDVNAVLDRLPTAVIEYEEDGAYTIAAEVYGKGIDMWLRSQGDNVRVLSPKPAASEETQKNHQ